MNEEIVIIIPSLGTSRLMLECHNSPVTPRKVVAKKLEN